MCGKQLPELPKLADDPLLRRLSGYTTVYSEIVQVTRKHPSSRSPVAIFQPYYDVLSLYASPLLLFCAFEFNLVNRPLITSHSFLRVGTKMTPPVDPADISLFNASQARSLRYRLPSAR